MKNNLALTCILVIAVILHLVLQQQCNNRHTHYKSTVDTLTRIVLKHDTMWYTLNNAVEKTNTTIKNDSIWLYIPDSTRTRSLSRYYNTGLFTRTYHDSTLTAVITDTVTHNTLIGQQLTYKLLRPVQYTYILPRTSATPSVKLYAGGCIGIIMSKRNATNSNMQLTPTLTLVTAHDKLYTAGYDIINHAYIIGIGWKIGFKR